MKNFNNALENADERVSVARSSIILSGTIIQGTITDLILCPLGYWAPSGIGWLEETLIWPERGNSLPDPQAEILLLHCQWHECCQSTLEAHTLGMKVAFDSSSNLRLTQPDWMGQPDKAH